MGMSHDNPWLETLFPTNAERTVPWPEVSERVTLFRPVGPLELQLIAESGWRVFPPRLPDQPIFYPVMNFEYAEEIARDWNANYGSHAGFVTRFDVDTAFVTRYPIQIAGSERIHQELWVPADELETFNTYILGRIEVVSSYIGEGYTGRIDPVTNLPDDLKSS
jgi:hypothetical protein